MKIGIFHGWGPGLFAVSLVLFLQPAASADTFEVTNNNNSGAGSLRQALLDAAANSDIFDTINIDEDLAGTVLNLDSTLPVDSGITINGPTSANFAINGGGSLRIMETTDTTTTSSVPEIVISRLTFQNGRANGGGAFRGQFENKLTFDDCNFLSNISEDTGGGAIRFSGKRLDLCDCVFANNQGLSINPPSFPGGGAIALVGTSTGGQMSDIERCDFVNNHTDSNGGAIQHGVNWESLDFVDCSFTTNDSDGSGGAISSAATNAAMFITRSLFDRNSADINGGALNKIRPDSVVGQNINSSTFSGNTAGENGGAIYLSGNNINSNYFITFCTIVGNSCGSMSTAANGGGIASGSTGTATVFTKVDDCIIAGNTDLGTLLLHHDVSGTFDSLGHNLLGSEVGSTGFTATTDFSFGELGIASLSEVVDPNLEDNGGRTKTHLPVFDGPAHGTGRTFGLPAADQRNLDRDVGTPDRGAVELQVVPYSEWSMQLPEASRGFNQDHENDGIFNGLEWKLGLDPTATDAGPLLTNLTKRDKAVTVDFTLAPDFPASLCIGQYSFDCGDQIPWKPAEFSTIDIAEDGSRTKRLSFLKGLNDPNPPVIYFRIGAKEN